MDYADMAASLRRKEWNEAQTEFNALPNKMFWDPAEIEIKADQQTGTRPAVAELVEITKKMTQNSSIGALYL